MTDGRTHSLGCWRDRGHHDCAIRLLDEIATAGVEHETRKYLVVQLGHWEWSELQAGREKPGAGS